jgi:hypothetical protein
LTANLYFYVWLTHGSMHEKGPFVVAPKLWLPPVNAPTPEQQKLPKASRLQDFRCL